MLVLFLRFAPWIVGSLVGVGLLVLINNWRTEAAKVPQLESKIESLNNQITLERLKVKENQQITTKAEETYAYKINELNADLKRLRDKPAKCIPVYITRPASSTNAKDRRNQQVEGNGITDIKLYDFAESCERDRAKVMALQEFILNIYEGNQ